jgi:DNA-directed RNA polymerase specialized sigma subunit
MILKEITKLTPVERDVIALWRVWFFPEVLDCYDIAKLIDLTPVQVSQIIKKFNQNCRAKLELQSFEISLKKCFEIIYSERTDAARSNML